MLLYTELQIDKMRWRSFHKLSVPHEPNASSCFIDKSHNLRTIHLHKTNLICVISGASAFHQAGQWYKKIIATK